MILAETQIRELIKNPKHSEEINKGRKYESRLRLFTEPKDESDAKKEPAYTEFQNRLKKLLSPKKYDRILDFIDYPLTVVDVAESCHSELMKVFDSRNSFFKHDYNNVGTRDNIDPKISAMNIRSFIEEQGSLFLKNRPNIIVVIDINEEGQPYLIPLKLSRVIDFELSEEDHTCFEYIIFEHSESEDEDVCNIACYDDQFFHVIKYNKKNDVITFEKSVPHTAGKCPARMFVSKRMNKNSDLLRLNPFSNMISKMQQFQIFDIYQFYVDHYAPFPIIEKPEEKCENTDCVGGYINNIITTYEIDAEGNKNEINTPKQTECDLCKQRQITGPGTVITIPPKFDKDDPTEAGVTRIVTTSTEQLEYTQSKCDKLEQYIEMKVVGKKSVLEKEAVNESQVLGSFESQKSVLLKWKTEFDELYKWIVKTSVKLLNKGVEVEVTANFGTEFFIYTVEDLMARYQMAIKNNFPQDEIDSIYRELIEVKYKGNNAKLDRSVIILALDPYPYSTINELNGLRQLNLVLEKEIVLKLNLTKFIQRFEMEQGSISEFGINLKPWDRVVKIKEVINKYLEEYETDRSKQLSPIEKGVGE